MEKLRNASDTVYIILNQNNSQLMTKNRDYKIYRSLEGLALRKKEYRNKKVAIFKLSEIVDYNTLIPDEYTQD